MHVNWLRHAVRFLGTYRFLLVCPALLLCAACDHTVSNMPPGVLMARTPSNTLQPGDVVRITFSGAPEYNQVQAIQSDGKISMPLVGSITVAGKTLKSFQDELSQVYKSQLQNTQVIVAQEKSAIPVILSGAVARPGKLILDEETTVLEAILQAGGATNIGNLSKVRIIRTVNGKHYTQVIDLNPAMQGKASRAFYVRYGDIIFVPERLF